MHQTNVFGMGLLRQLCPNDSLQKLSNAILWRCLFKTLHKRDWCRTSYTSNAVIVITQAAGKF